MRAELGRSLKAGEAKQGREGEPSRTHSLAATSSVTDKMKWTFKFRSNAPLVSVQVLSTGSTWLRGRATLQNGEKKRKMGAVVKTRRMAEGGRQEGGETNYTSVNKWRLLCAPNVKHWNGKRKH